MKYLVNYLGCGWVSERKGACDFKVKSITDINKKVIPFFDKCPIFGVKALDYADFCRVAQIMETKAHLTQEGLNEILKIKTGMNKGRSNI